MADEEQRLTRPQRVSRPSKRARDGQANGRAATQDERSVRMFEADAVITTLHELCLIPASSRPDRRSIALAVAALRKELQGSATEQGQFYGLQVNTIRNVMTDWVEDVDARLEQALRYRALPVCRRRYSQEDVRRLRTPSWRLCAMTGHASAAGRRQNETSSCAHTPLLLRRLCPTLHAPPLGSCPRPPELRPRTAERARRAEHDLMAVAIIYIEEGQRVQYDGHVVV